MRDGNTVRAHQFGEVRDAVERLSTGLAETKRNAEKKKVEAKQSAPSAPLVSETQTQHVTSPTATLAVTPFVAEPVAVSAASAPPPEAPSVAPPPAVAVAVEQTQQQPQWAPTSGTPVASPPPIGLGAPGTGMSSQSGHPQESQYGSAPPPVYGVAASPQYYQPPPGRSPGPPPPPQQFSPNQYQQTSNTPPPPPGHYPPHGGLPLYGGPPGGPGFGPPPSGGAGYSPGYGNPQQPVQYGNQQQPVQYGNTQQPSPRAAPASFDVRNVSVSMDKVVEDFANMGFTREQVRGVIRTMQDSGKEVDLNQVLDRLMNPRR